VTPPQGPSEPTTAKLDAIRMSPNGEYFHQR
jgi:hypothetical protein